MDLRKTRVWGESLQSMVELANKGALGMEQPAREVHATKLVTKDRKTGTFIGHVSLFPLDVPSRSEHCTRLLPIESVLLAERDAREAKERAEEQQSPRSASEALDLALPAQRPSKTGTYLRRGMIVLAVLAIGSIKLYGSRHVAASSPSRVVPALPVTLPAVEVDAVPVVPPQLAQTKVRQRAALDALASGDYTAAQHAYAELARATQGRTPYSEAARILDERLQHSAKP